ncbi:hypothetical protein BDP27DRAFT_1339445 [Rhodocollybia butyracea]|uniref:Uncharacterized protein n=1 Tax=Rhodocollybia butyracea TaxID=206335 RepID=A0A9P5P7Y7_9AGAR|nr:hypothetical protein BDP27DRAFT_1339445 [Rhodocollybia butyracea]
MSSTAQNIAPYNQVAAAEAGKEKEVAQEAPGEEVQMYKLDPTVRHSSVPPPNKKMDTAYANASKPKDSYPKMRTEFRYDFFTFAVGDCVIACPEAIEPAGGYTEKELMHKGHIGIVKGIRMTRAFGILVKLGWFACFEDLNKRYYLPKPDARVLEPKTGEYELFGVAEVGVCRLVDIIYVLDLVPARPDFGVMDVNEPWIGNETYYIRAEIKVPQTTKKPGKIVYSEKNEEHAFYNPSTSCQLWCRWCRHWFNFDEVDKKDYDGPILSGNYAERSQDLTVLRGGGWMNKHREIWKEVLKKHPGDIAYAWLVVGTYQLFCGKFRTLEHKAAALYGRGVAARTLYFCRECHLKC